MSTESTIVNPTPRVIESTIDPLAPIPMKTKVASWLTAAVVIIPLAFNFFVCLWAGLDPNEPGWVDDIADFWAMLLGL